MKKSKKKKAPTTKSKGIHSCEKCSLDKSFYHRSLIYTRQEDKMENKYKTIKRLDGCKKKRSKAYDRY